MSEEFMKQVKLVIYTSVLTLSGLKSADESKIIIDSHVDDKNIELIAIIKKEGVKSIYEIVISLQDLVQSEKIEVCILVSRHSVSDNPRGTFTVSSKHTLFLATEKHMRAPETLPHPSLVVDYIANNILEMGVY